MALLPLFWLIGGEGGGVGGGVKPAATTAVCYQQEASHSGAGANADAVCVCLRASV